MAGAKQHYIPQLLLKGFGRSRGKKVVQVVVFSRDKVFTTATDGVAAQRYFYSKPDGTNETLDDRITSYENAVNSALLQLRSRQQIDADLNCKLAEFVVHLCVRAAVVRDSFGFAAKSIIGRFERDFSSPVQARKALGIDSLVLPKMIRDEFDSLYDQHSTELAKRGLSKLQFRDLAARWTRENFNENFQKNLRNFSDELKSAQFGIEETIGNAHRDMLNHGLAPKERVSGLSKLEWRVVPCQNSDLVLPDCVAVSCDHEGRWMPYVLTKADSISRLIMPISNQYALYGTAVNSEGGVPGNYNELLVRCSWQFFVSKDQDQSLDLLRDSIGTALLDHVREALTIPIALIQ
jgi:hypothetical protein